MLTSINFVYALDNITDTANKDAVEAARDALLLPLAEESQSSQDTAPPLSRSSSKPMPTPKQTPSRTMDAEKA